MSLLLALLGTGGGVNGTASGALAALALSPPGAAAAGAGQASGSAAALGLTAGTASGSGAAVAGAGIAALTLAAPQGTAAGATVVHASAAGYLGALQLGSVPAVAEATAKPGADRFNYGAQFSAALQGRYTADPIIGRMAQRMRKHRRW